MKQLSLLLLLAASTISLKSQEALLGTWKSVDDETGEAKSHVQIFKKGDQVFGKIVRILTEEGDEALCESCKGKRKNKPVLGMTIIESLEQENDGRWRGGDILDPESGNTYGCVIWVPAGKSDELKVRGRHWTGLYRTQTWFRVK